MDNHDTPVSEFLLMDSLRLYECLVEEGSQRHGLVEAHDAVICLNVLQRAEHRGLIPSYSDNVRQAELSFSRNLPMPFADLSSSSGEWFGIGKELDTSSVPSRSSPRTSPCALEPCASRECLMIFDTT